MTRTEGPSAREQIVQGYLRKAGTGTWRKRWFRLENARLFCFKGSAARVPRAVLDVARGEVHVEENDEGARTLLSVIAGSGESLLLEAATAQDASAWRDALSVSIENCPREAGTYDDAGKSRKRQRHASPGGQNADGERGQGHGAGGSVSSDREELPVMLVLEVIEGPLSGQRFEIGHEGVDIIRKPSGIAAAHMKALKQLQLPDPDISRKHAQIRYGPPPAPAEADGEGGQAGEGARRGSAGGYIYSIRDMGSLNGTIVNGQRISEEKCVSSWEKLNGGDHVLLGKTKVAVFFSVKLPDLPLTKEEAERKKRKAERKARREQRRGLLLSKAMGLEGETGVLGQRRGGGDKPVANLPSSAQASASSKVRASAEVFLTEVLGVNGQDRTGNPAETGPNANNNVPKLAPNKVALTNIVAGVLDHNERVQEEEDAAAQNKRLALSHHDAEDRFISASHPPPRHFPPPPPQHHRGHHLPPTYDGSSAGVPYGAYGYGNWTNSGAYAAYGAYAPDQSHWFFNRPPPPPAPVAAGGNAHLPHIPPPTLPHAVGRANGSGGSMKEEQPAHNVPSAKQLQMQGLPTKFK